MSQFKKRNIGQEILESIKEIKAWQHGKKILKPTKIILLISEPTKKAV